jgi:hypothetical protein
MGQRHRDRGDVLAFWLGMTALLLSLVPLMLVACVTSRPDWLLGWVMRHFPFPWVAATVVASQLAAIVVGGASLLVKRNWRGATAILYAAFSMLAMLAIFALMAQAPDR